MSFWTYMLHCNGGSYYVGHTDNLERRTAQHETGQIPGFAKDHMPVKLVWSEIFSSREQALAMERRIKGWSRAKKMALIRSDWDEISHLAHGEEKGRPSTSSGRTD
jgi:putative endonuclease